MKKILVLMLVLGIASMATAGLVVTQDGSTLTISTDEDYALNPLDTGQFLGQLVVNEAGSLDGTSTILVEGLKVGGYVAMLYNSMPASSFGLGGPELIDWSYMVITDASVTNLGLGDVLSYGTTGLVSGVLYDDSGNVLATFIPEPMTIGLLGLGGLFLRRRK